jgi:hypothetical protein
MPVIGFLNSASPDLFAHLARAFCRALSQSNFVESRNFTLAADQGLELVGMSGDGPTRKNRPPPDRPGRWG